MDDALSSVMHSYCNAITIGIVAEYVAVRMNANQTYVSNVFLVNLLL